MKAVTMTALHHVVLADDHALIREGLKMMFSERPDYEVVGEACDGQELLDLLKSDALPDAVIVDLSMPRLDGIDAIRELRRISQDVKVLVLTIQRDVEFLRQALKAGANGYLLKEEMAEELFVALDTILESREYISPRFAGWERVEPSE